MYYRITQNLGRLNVIVECENEESALDTLVKMNSDFAPYARGERGAITIRKVGKLDKVGLN